MLIYYRGFSSKKTVSYLEERDGGDRGVYHPLPQNFDAYRPEVAHCTPFIKNIPNFPDDLQLKFYFFLI